MAQQPVEKLDAAALAQIRDEGLSRSQVMEPQIAQAGDWALKKFGEWGLSNPRRETFQFRPRVVARALYGAHDRAAGPDADRIVPPWTPGTSGTLTAAVVRVQIDSEADFERYRGKLAGVIVLTQPARAVEMLEGVIVHRMGDEDIAEAMQAPTPAPPGRGAGGAPGGGRGRGATGGQTLAQQVQQFYRAEGVAALFNRGADSAVTSIGSGLSASALTQWVLRRVGPAGGRSTRIG
ncbi:MAG: hypothetical protein H0X64_10995, partial [Gemmatimonadaceae bacterium]|nr:hypothetical protein [Gemmatimonadaceae bacterium]